MNAMDKRLDAIDLIMTALKDHEKRLDKITDKLEKIVKDIEDFDFGETMEGT